MRILRWPQRLTFISGWQAVLSEALFARLVSLLIILVMGVHLVFLTQYPFIFGDEAWNSNAAWNWVTTGVNFDSMHKGALDQYGFEWVRRLFIGEAPWWVMFKLFGVGPFQARFVSWIFGGALLLAMVWVGRRNYSLFTGLVAALLMSLTAPFLQASHYARQDIILAAILMFNYGFTLWALERDRWWAHLLVGFIAAVSVDVHQYAIFFLPSLVGLYVLTYGRRLLHQRGTWLCALGGLLGFGVFAVIHILPNPSVYLLLNSFSLGGKHASPFSQGLRGLIVALGGEFSRYHFFTNSLDLVMIGAGALFLIVRRSKADQRWLTFVGVAFIVFTLLVGSKEDLYAIHLYSFFILAVAEALVSLLRAGPRFSAQQAFSGALLVLFVMSSGLHLAKSFYDSRGYSYAELTQPMRAAIPAGAKVLASPYWWFAFTDANFQSVLSLGYYRFFNDYNIDKAMEVIQPDYFIVGPEVTWLLTDQPYDRAKGGHSLPRKEFEDFLTKRATVHTEFSHPLWGDFKIYAIRWK